jgi:MFS superfamily sulfate permease-like transporter
MKIILKKVSLAILLVVISTIIFYFDYYYYKSFYHSLIVMVLFTLLYCAYNINVVLNDILKTFRKWLGN